MLNLSHYIKGLRKGKEINRLERSALNDSFLTDTLEGYNKVSDENHMARIAKMQAEISKKARTHFRQNRFYWLVAAASFALLLSVGGFFLWKTDPLSPENSIVQKTENIENRKIIIPKINENADNQLIAKNIETLEKAEIPLEKIETKSVLKVGTKEITDESKINSETISEDLQERMSSVKVSEKMNNSLTKKKINGTVVDENGEPLIGATLKVKNKNIGTMTNLDGHFELYVPNDEKYLQAEFIGYTPENVPIDSDKPMMIAMNESVNTLNEVVVTGYATQKRRDMTAASASVKIEKTITPEPVIGKKAYNNYLKESLIRPNDNECKNVKGNVILQFSVDSNGHPANIRVIKSLCQSADNEAIRLLTNGEGWTQGNKETQITVRF
jgi:hypothetical protein